MSELDDLEAYAAGDGILPIKSLKPRKKRMLRKVIERATEGSREYYRQESSGRRQQPSLPRVKFLEKVYDDLD